MSLIPTRLCGDFTIEAAWDGCWWENPKESYKWPYILRPSADVQEFEGVKGITREILRKEGAHLGQMRYFDDLWRFNSTERHAQERS